MEFTDSNGYFFFKQCLVRQFCLFFLLPDETRGLNMTINKREKLMNNKNCDCPPPPPFRVFLHEYSLHLLAKGDHGKLCS